MLKVPKAMLTNSTTRSDITLCGTNVSRLWDERFITQALVETVPASDEENKQGLTEALRPLDRCQIRDNLKHFGASNRLRTAVRESLYLTLFKPLILFGYYVDSDSRYEQRPGSQGKGAKILCLFLGQLAKDMPIGRRVKGG
ncbi:hypothetical protein BGW80DRAFT_1250756 [Lactifluus volemus]|nr:hypothetical protein BGW80DRAFT_1250756 [Lactifluus volemus]